jgi:hypothetical protein
MRISERLWWMVLALTLSCWPAAAQDRPFLFSISTPPPPMDKSHVSVHVDAGFGESPFDLVESERPEQRFGIQASFGNGLTLLARAGITSSDGDPRASEQAELLYNLLRAPSRQGSLAVGLGMRHEAGGVNVLLGRVVAGRRFAEVWRLDGNAIFERPFSPGRDAVDLVTTFGVARRIASAVHVGVELIGEDLEGFWEADEAEGGARLLAGPSIRIAPRSDRWQASVAGGPVIHATRSSIRSDATRSLPVTNRDGYAARASLTYNF